MGRISGLLLILLLVLGGCSPPAELVRPNAPPDVAARTLLPPGRVEAINFPRAIDGAQVAADGGGRMIALRFANAADAASGLEAFAKREIPSDISFRFSVSVGSLQYLRYSGGSTFGLLWVSDAWVLFAEAASADRLVALIAASRAGGVEEDYAQLKRFLWVMAGILVLVLVVVALLVLWLFRSQTIAPVAGAAAVSREALIARLLALNDPSRPWLVRAGPEADLVVEWKYADAAWWGIMTKHGVREIHRLRLFLNEAAHRVGALDETSEIEWSGGVMRSPSFHVSKSRFRGIQLFKFKREIAYGFDTPTGGGFGKKLDVNFDLNSLKQPVIATVTAAGWSYAPVMRPQ